MEGFNVDTYVAPVSVQGDHLATGYVGINTRTLECSAGTVEVDPDTGASTHDPDAQGFQSSSTATSNGVAARALQSIGDPPCTGASEPYFLDVSVDRPGVPATRWTTARTRSYVEPSVAGDQVFVSGSTTVAAFDATGCGASVCSPIWSREFSESSSLVAVATGPVHVSSAGQVMALDRTTGTELWRVDLEGTVRGIARANGMIYATVERPGEASLLVAFPAGGCRAPTCAATRTWTLAGTDTSSPTVAGGVVYTSSGDALQAFDASGCGEATCPALVTVPDVAGGSVSVSNGHVLVSGLRTLTALALA
jgi:outer membrane protein assembly factor BamB